MHDTYGPYIIVEIKDAQRRMCVLRCIYPFDGFGSFRICLFLSRHYPIISQLFVRFKLSSINNNDEYFKTFQTRIQTIFDETSYKCFYSGQLCLNTCLNKLKHLFYLYNKQEQKLSSTIITNKSNTKQHNELINSLDLDSPNGINHNNKNLNKIIDQLLLTRTNDSQIPNGPKIRTKSRTCGARFAGGTLLICFGRTLNPQQQQSPTSAPPIMTDGLIGRRSPFHMRSISLTVTKSRGSSSTDEQSSR